jgi:hypothetical protein
MGVAASSLKEKILRNSKRSLFLAGPVLLWIGVISPGLLSADFESAGSLVFAAVLFVAALPLSCLIRVDVFRESFGIESHSVLLCLELAIAYINIVALTGGLGLITGRFRRARRPDPAQPSPNGQANKVNGSGSFGRWRLS